MRIERINFRKLCSISIVLALCSLMIFSLSFNRSASAYMYGYKEGDVYEFSVETTSTAKTEEGTSTTSENYVVTYKIRNIDKDTGGYRVKVDCRIVTATGMMGGSMIQDIIVEGDSQLNRTVDLSGPPTSPFVTTDWSARGDEWNDYVDALGNTKGWMVKDYTKGNGIFTVNIEFNVDDGQSLIDFDSDGNRDGYTGSMSTRLEYDGNGVLSSYSTQSTMQFNPRNTLEYSVTTSRGAASPLSNVLIYIAIGAVSFVVALVIGFFIGKGRVPKAKAPPQLTAT